MLNIPLAGTKRVVRKGTGTKRASRSSENTKRYATLEALNKATDHECIQSEGD